MSANKTQNLWYIGGLHFGCIECGACCSGPDEGYIWITKPEIEILAEYLRVTIEQLQKKYLNRIGWRTTIIENANSKDCIFLVNSDSGRKCSIYPARPNQCRTWPFWTANLVSCYEWNRATAKCLGVNRGRFYSFSEIEKLRKQKKWWTDEKG